MPLFLKTPHTRARWSGPEVAGLSANRRVRRLRSNLRAGRRGGSGAGPGARPERRGRSAAMREPGPARDRRSELCSIIATPSHRPFRGEPPLRSVSLSSIPAGTFTPLKQLLWESFASDPQLRGLERRAAADSRAGPGPDTRAGPGRDTRAGPGRDTRAGLGRDTRAGPGRDTRAGPGPDTRLGPRPEQWPNPQDCPDSRPGPVAERPPKRRAAEPPEQESPAKVFQRMKMRAEQQRRAATDLIVSPAAGRHWPGTARAEDSAQPAPNPVCPQLPGMEPRAMSPAEPPVLETPQKFFLRVKWQLQQQQHKATAPSTQTQQNIPLSVQPACAEQPGNEAADKDDDVDVFLVESVEVDADGEMSQSTMATPLQVNSTSWENEDQVEGRWRNGEAERAEEDRRELQPSEKPAAPAVEKAPETNPEKPSQSVRDILLWSPIRFPRNQKLEKNPKVLLDKAVDQPAGKAQKEKNICLNSWRIKVLAGNMAICVEGKRKDMRQLLWHSSAVTERLTHNQVRTSTGAVYLLQGKIDSAAMRREGFPYRFTKRFTYGFSRRWKEYVEEFLEEKRRKEQKSQRSDVEENEENVEGADVLETARGSARIAKKRALRNPTYEVSPGSDENIFITPKDRPRNDSSRVYTRSGRLIKPPLNFWCGQREFVDQNLNVTIENGGVDYLSLVRSPEM
ncbi:hypothetical protein Nmel_009441 [Mimus melanotis]